MKRLLTAAVVMLLVLSFSAVGLARCGGGGYYRDDYRGGGDGYYRDGYCDDYRGGDGYHCW